jgi:hypothetical protein
MSDQPAAGATAYKTQHKTQQTNIYALSGIQTRDPRNQAAADLRLKPHNHRDQKDVR